MGGKILIVDDVATNRIVMKVKLTGAGYLPVVAADGTSCLALAKAQAPALILLDCNLPDMPGTEVLRQLRADQGDAQRQCRPDMMHPAARGVGMGVAADVQQWTSANWHQRTVKLAALRDQFEARLRAACPELHVYGQSQSRLPQTSYLRLGMVHADLALKRQSELGVMAASSVPACSMQPCSRAS